MYSSRSKLGQIKHALMIFILLTPMAGNASTVVSMQTSLGNINIQLFDESAPKTVANFLAYVNSDAYTNSLIHRSIPGFIVQGGGFTWDTVNNKIPPAQIPTNPPVTNEFGASNLRGTIAMAKVGGDPNSATSQWFFNLANNSANLDLQNGGFTVFGEVIGDGMSVVDAIAALPTADAGGAFTDLPLALPLNGGSYTTQNIVLVKSVQSVPLPAPFWLFGSVLIGYIKAFSSHSRIR